MSYLSGWPIWLSSLSQLSRFSLYAAKADSVSQRYKEVEIEFFFEHSYILYCIIRLTGQSLGQMIAYNADSYLIISKVLFLAHFQNYYYQRSSAVSIIHSLSKSTNVFDDIQVLHLASITSDALPISFDHFNYVEYSLSTSINCIHTVFESLLHPKAKLAETKQVSLVAKLDRGPPYGSKVLFPRMVI